MQAAVKETPIRGNTGCSKAAYGVNTPSRGMMVQATFKR